ncbi:MAG: LysR family transcriptional regulator [Cohaesibacter sp.]|nr:LysR family transcriptional regulator [Cohaesibacter sp.]
MKWDDMQLFHAAANAGSMNGAARRLDLSQPQLSRRLRQMEERMGARLFDRTPQGLRLTSAGESLMPLAEQMRHTADAVLRLQPKLSTQGLRKVRLSIDDLRTRFLTLHLEELQEAIGDIELEFISTHQHLSLMNRTTDMQVRTCLPDSDDVILRKLGTLTYKIYAHERYLKQNPQPDFAAYCRLGRWIGICAEPLWYPDQLRWLTDHVTGTIQMRFNCMSDCLGAAKQGAGLALLPSFLAERELDLICLTPQQAQVSSPEHLIVNRDVLREPAIRTVMDAVISIYKHMH